MKRFLVLGPASGQSKAVFEVVDGAFDGSPDLIGLISLGSTSQSGGIRPQVLLRIDVDHPAAGRRRARIFALADTMVFPGGGILLPPNFWTDKFITDNATFEFADTFRFYGKGGIPGTAVDTVSIDRIVRVFQARARI